jgi:hypothetical protein
MPDKQHKPVKFTYSGPGQPGRGPTSSTKAATKPLARPPKSGSIIISDSDEEEASSDVNLLQFYGLTGASSDSAAGRMKYQDLDLGRKKKYPSRTNGLGFDMATLRSEYDWPGSERTAEDTEASWNLAMYMTIPPLGFDEVVSREWAQDAGSGGLVYGFPLTGDVVFFRPGNYTGARAACFFKAVGYFVYGTHKFYQRVQAEHLQYFGDVLEWEDHPRHQLYNMMNAKFYETLVEVNRESHVPTVANFFQLLSIPHIWMPLDMLDVTADLYNLFIMVYTINDKHEIIEVSAKGSYNARHICLLFDGHHFQPMVPNEFLASEFTLPRITYNNTRGLPLLTGKDIDKSSIDLACRNTWRSRLDRTKGALPVDHVFYKETLKDVMTGTRS